eukprot:2216289-Pyramimonas_sp.AAC.1
MPGQHHPQLHVLLKLLPPAAMIVVDEHLLAEQHLCDMPGKHQAPTGVIAEALPLLVSAARSHALGALR